MGEKKLKNLNRKQILKDNTSKIGWLGKFAIVMLLTVIFSLIFKSIELSIKDIPIEVYLANKEVYVKKWVTIALITSATIMAIYTLSTEYRNISIRSHIKSGRFDILMATVSSIEKDDEHYKNKRYQVNFDMYDLNIQVSSSEKQRIHAWDTYYIPVIMKDDNIKIVLKEYSTKEFKLDLNEEFKSDKDKGLIKINNKLSGEYLN